MAALSPGNLHGNGFVALSEGLAFETEGCRGIHTAGTAYEHLAFVFGVEVDKCLAGEETRFKRKSAVHAGLFRDSEQALQLTSRKVAFQKCKAGSYADAVVCAQSGILCYHPAVLDLIGDGLGKEVEIESRVFLADHILMGLKHKGGNVFLARSGFFHYKDIACLVCLAFQTMVFGKLLKPCGHRGFVAAFTRNRRNFLKNLEDRIGIHNTCHFSLSNIRNIPCNDKMTYLFELAPFLIIFVD